MKTQFLTLLSLSTLALVQVTAASDWVTVASPNAGKAANTLLGVAAVAENDVWAVGAAFDDRLSAYQSLIEHWNGTRWARVRSPNASTGYNILNGVAALAPNDVWAVGFSAVGNATSTLVQHWNGAAWAIVPSPNVAGRSNTLQAASILAANDIWAVGYTTDANFVQNPLTLHWNGAAWSIVPSPPVENGLLFAVAGALPNDVWATGTGQNERSLTIHWNGSAWSVVASPNDSSEDNILFGVAARAPNDVWAVGNAGSLKTLALHWDGLSWSIVPTPAFGSDASNEVLVGIVALSNNNIWAVGQYLVPLLGSAQQTLTENWNGTSWSVVPSPNAKHSNNRLHAVTVTPNGTLWAVGTGGVFARPERTLILRKDP